jgi:Flp pilus assembly protein TadB
VPLSDHEQRLLEQIERALYAEDPKFASTVSSTDLRTHARRRVRRAFVLLVLGMVALLAGVMVPSVPLGVAGFCIMLGAAGFAASQYKRLAGRPDLRVAGSDRATARRKPRKLPLLQRMEERFRRRFDER